MADEADEAKSTLHEVMSTTSSISNTRLPDKTFQHEEAFYPGLVIEVAYSQKSKDLPAIAEDYLFGSDGNIRQVVGFDIGYRSSSILASVSTWQLLNHNEGGELKHKVHRTFHAVS